VDKIIAYPLGADKHKPIWTRQSRGMFTVKIRV
jgi:hypothetical protein